MKIFIDSANLSEIQECVETGLIDGITTNPTLIRKSGMAPNYVYDRLVEMGIEDISMEVTGTYEQMLNEAAKLSETYGNVATIKVPMTPDGLKICRVLKGRVRTNVTLVFNAAQALLAATCADGQPRDLR